MIEMEKARMINRLFSGESESNVASFISLTLNGLKWLNSVKVWNWYL